MRSVRGWSIRICSFHISYCLCRGAIASCSKCSVSAIIGGSRRPSTMLRARRSTKRQSCLDMGYPGGPAIEKMASGGNANAVPLPRPLVGSGEPHFSFAGLKSAVQRAVASGDYARGTSQPRSSRRWSIASSIARAWRSRRAILRALVVAGGVAANQAIRTALAKLARENGRHFSVPPAWLCTDNAAMIAWAGVGAIRPRADRHAIRAGSRALAARRSAEKVRGAGVKA